jgi:acyl-CoA reductase-like NAD-dependent aldehyde dehydrogenase
MNSTEAVKLQEAEVRREALRIAGERVERTRTIAVHNPYTGAVVGTVPKATVDDVRRALSIARGYRAKLTRPGSPI